MTRYIKLHDSILQWQWFNDGNTLKLWIYLLVNASYKDIQFKGQTLRRGQCLVSVRQLSDRLHISVNTVNRSLRILRNNNCIAIENAGSLGSVISVVNYANYQGVSENDTATDTATDTVTDTATDTQSKKVYKEKEINKEKDIVAVDTREGWQVAFIDTLDNQWREFVSQELRMPRSDVDALISEFRLKVITEGSSAARPPELIRHLKNFMRLRKNMMNNNKSKTTDNANADNIIDHNARHLYNSLHSAYRALRSGSGSAAEDSPL